MKAPQTFLVIVVFIAGAAALSVIRFRSQAGDVLHTVGQFEQLKRGDRVRYLCQQCDATKEIQIDTESTAMELCREGATISCPGCKETMKVVVKSAPARPASMSEVRFVSDKGHECLVLAKAPPGKQPSTQLPP